jgi:PAS domain S-box-containing protein
VPDALLRPLSVLTVAGLLICLLATLEWYFRFDFSLGIAYTIPVALASLVLTGRQIIMLAILCAYVRGQFTPQMTPLEQGLRMLMATTAYCGVGLLIAEMSRNRKSALANMSRLQLEQRLRKRAEEQLRLLAESSPAGMLTVDGQGHVLASNRALAELFSATPEAFNGRRVGDYLPMLMQALRMPAGPRHMRTAASGWARRDDGTMFPVMSWFSTYTTGEQRFLAAIVVDVSEEVRDRERENYRHLADAQRLLAGAVSHEIRNLCSAAAVVTANIERRSQTRDARTAIAHDPDWAALTNLIAGLSRIASVDLKARAQGPAPAIGLPAVLDQLRVVIEQDWLDEGATLVIDEKLPLPPVHADGHGLLQVFLNLAQNSLRAIAQSPERVLTVSAFEEVTEQRVIVSFVDSGHGVTDTAGLFHPFRPGSDGTGLGLYVSRTLMRSFGGDLIFVPAEHGCRFDVVLSAREKPLTDATVLD